VIELWNVSRALGLVALLLLSVVLALGALHNTTLSRAAAQALPRFAVVALHRNLALITVVFVALHVVTVLVTPYLPLRWYHLVVPGTASFNPWPVGLGAVALDLLLAVVISSSLRRHLSKRVWLVVHWSSYVCFPVAVAHAVANASFRGGSAAAPGAPARRPRAHRPRRGPPGRRPRDRAAATESVISHGASRRRSSAAISVLAS
jgi:methionine sulfoxide reductase heme-binding subunit